MRKVHTTCGSPLERPVPTIVNAVLDNCLRLTVLALVSLALVGCGSPTTSAVEQILASEDGENPNAITIETAGGPLSLVPDLEGGVVVPGIPIYPGAQAIGVDPEITMGGIGPASGMDYHTSDPMGQVAAFYTQELASKAEPMDRNVEILFNFEDGNMQKVVRLSEHPGFGGTKIWIYQMPK